MTAPVTQLKIKIAHIAVWTKDIEATCEFWEHFFRVTTGPLYSSRNRPGFQSRFLEFSEGPSIEVMSGPWVEPNDSEERAGYAHVAVSLGSEAEVNRMAEIMGQREALVSGPRWTGDGFYEAVIRDPGGLLIEITI